MNRTEALRSAGAFTVPVALVVGGSMLTLTITNAGNYRPEAAPPRPGPTVTTTAPPATGPPAKPVRSHTSAPAPRVTPTGGRVEAASAPRSGGSSTARQPGPGVPSGPAPRPTSEPLQPATQCNVSVAMAALDACVKLGGTR